MDNFTKAVEALKSNVHDETGWLSDAQGADLEIFSDNSVRFCGQGSFDLAHMVGIVFVTLGIDR